jgi:hypothetical protein
LILSIGCMPHAWNYYLSAENRMWKFWRFNPFLIALQYFDITLFVCLCLCHCPFILTALVFMSLFLSLIVALKINFNFLIDLMIWCTWSIFLIVVRSSTGSFSKLLWSIC